MLLNAIWFVVKKHFGTEKHFSLFFYFGVGYRVAVVVVFASPSLELGFGWMDYKDKAPANLVPRLAVSVSAS
jgi:hypothetical protein